jgi:hypothetical protein
VRVRVNEQPRNIVSLDIFRYCQVTYQVASIRTNDLFQRGEINQYKILTDLPEIHFTVDPITKEDEINNHETLLVLIVSAKLIGFFLASIPFYDLESMKRRI